MAVVAFVAYKLLWTAVEPKLEHRIAEIGLTPDEVAANGPLPGDVEPMTFGSLITPGFGGRVYFSTGRGFIVLQVVPKAAPPPRH